jgi:hypothetical protein
MLRLAPHVEGVGRKSISSYIYRQDGELIFQVELISQS